MGARLILTQEELERSALHRSRERIQEKFDENEKKGRANDNAYAQPIYRRYVFPLRDIIIETLRVGLAQARRRQAHVALLKPLDPDVSAFMAVRTVLVEMAADATITARSLASRIGRVLHRELVLSVYEDISPELFYEVTHDLDRRRSKSERHRFNALMGAARNRGLTNFPVWRNTDREQLGMWFVEQLRVLGMLDVRRYRESNLSGQIREVLAVDMTPEALRIMDKVRELVEINTPIHLPCIEPPIDWTSMSEGGWHTPELRRIMPHCVKIRRVKNFDVYQRIREADLSQHVLPAINHLQHVRWAVNTRMLAAVKDIARSSLDLEEVLSEKGPDAPERPSWLAPKGSGQVLTEEQEAAFKAWKRATAQWWTEHKLRGQRLGRFKLAVSTAEKFKSYEQLYFVYQADFRGRLYAQTIGISPQGSDIQKAMLRFAEGKPVHTPDAIKWFKVNGANRFGMGKETLASRVAWVDEYDHFIRQMADDPVSHYGWQDADEPLQFLAWAQEYAAWRRDPERFLSYLPVGLDGSCNGLQHFSAMLRDPIGGKATNLLDGKIPNDIYAQVAAVTQAKLERLNPDTLCERDREFRRLWLAHGINRTLVKRSVMTLPYGSTRFACSDFITKDYLRHGSAVEFEPAQYRSAANFLSYIVWQAIGDVVVAGAKAMVWLQTCAATIIERGEQQIQWVTPSGFPVTQVYNRQKEVRANTRLFGGCRLSIWTDVDDPRLLGHKNGLAPNFVHSMDASHLALTVNACKAAGINSLAMIHDDYGTHAADTQELYGLIRRVFVDMYSENDPIMDFYRSYLNLPEPPQRGDLDLQHVLQSAYFFN